VPDAVRERADEERALPLGRVGGWRLAVQLQVGEAALGMGAHP
jgi:hypothetical protein